MLKTGLYEEVISKDLGVQIDSQTDKLTKTATIDEAEASKILAKYIAQIVERGLDNLVDNGGNIQNQIALANKIVSTIKAETREDVFDGMSVDERAEQLLALLDKTNTIYALNEKAEIVRPVTSLSQSSLFTGAVNEPQMFTELKKEIVSCNKIDMLVSFIKWSGLRLIIDELRTFTNNGGKFRIITTSYMGATDVKAVEELRKLQNTEVKISYDTKRTRLHAKTYVFYRETDYTTAYVGSSNLSNVAISSGLEWNIKVTKQDLPDTISKISATFESYWNSPDFEVYNEEQKEKLEKALKAEKYFEGNPDQQYTFDITPYPYQQEILDKIKAEREVRNNYKNLVVAATGTGKTVISAFDYKNFCKKLGRPANLLFVAHREEILKQSVHCFRGVLKDANFGELFVGKYKPESLNDLFVSVQTLNSQDLTSITSSDFYDYIIVDEFHHAAAPIYQQLLSYYKPKVLLGLTATPERMDGKNVLEYFNNRISAEIRLPEAIDRKLLCPFQYFGVTDTVDLDTLKWERGGYSKSELTNVYAFDYAVARKRVTMVVESLNKYVTDMNAVKGLGFCVSKEHAKFMSDFFNEHGIPSIYLVSETCDEERSTAKQRLENGEIRFIFIVDIYNEGVDIPEVNTILFLRPTESLTVFLQQLGRGLRLSEGKECLTVLDFIGQANKNYNFESKFAALLSNTNRNVASEIKNGFVSAPKGCYIQLEKKVKEYILANIKKSINTKTGLVVRLSTFEDDTGLKPTIYNFCHHYGIEPRQFYNKKHTYFSLCKEAGLIEMEDCDLKEDAAKILNRLSTVDSLKFIDYIWGNIDNIEGLSWDNLTKKQQLYWKMLYVSVWEKPVENFGFANELEGVIAFKKNKAVYEEFSQLLEYCYESINIVTEEVDLGFESTLELHSTYTRAQLLAGLDFLENYAVSEGVKYLKDKDTDLLFITLNKANKYYSPTTAYHDYSISDKLFHWQSQSTTSDTSATGMRYRSRDGKFGNILLFVREAKSDEHGPMPFVFLGKAKYSSHTGSRPMSIIWELENSIPAKFLKKTNKLI